jgi:hypothetical protein
VELAKEWRTNKILRHLDVRAAHALAVHPCSPVGGGQASLVAVDATHSLLVDGTGDVLESQDGILCKPICILCVADRLMWPSCSCWQWLGLRSR